MELEPYLFISGGKCEEALNFYKGVFKGDVTAMSRWKDAPAEMGLPAELGSRVMNANFKSPGVSFMAADAQPTTQYGMGRISLAIGTSDVAEAQRVWDALAKDGEVEMPMEETFWAAKFGMLTDKYGVDWMINCALPK